MLYALVVMILPLNFTALIGSNWISSIILINLMVIWISRLLLKCSTSKVFDFRFEEGSCVWVYVYLANISNLDLLVDQEMLSNVGEAWCSPDNLVAGGLHLSHIHHYHRQARGAWGNNFEKVFLSILSRRSFFKMHVIRFSLFGRKCSLWHQKNCLAS